MIYIDIISNCYFVSVLCMLPALLLCWLFGLRPKFLQTVTMAGWGANAVLLVALSARL